MSSQASLSSDRPPARKSAPVTAHPWFAGIVALWFAALLGLSSLALAPAMLERIVAASGIASFVSAAAPPLGQTARLLVVLGLAGLGGALGLVLGRMLAARPRRAAPGDDVVYVSADGAIEDAAPEVEAETGISLRDRLARLTGQGDGPRDFNDLPKLRTRDRHPDAPGRKPLSLADVMVRDAGSPVSEAIDEPVVPAAQSSEEADEPAPLSRPAPSMADDWAAPEPDTAPAALAQEAAPDPDAAEEPLELAVVAACAAPAPLFTAVTDPAPAIAKAALDSLGVVQLTERLAIAMEARRERDARRAHAAKMLAEDARAESAQAEGSPIVLPALRPVEVAPAPALVSAPSSELPKEAELESPELENEVLESGYSSLLGLSRPPLPRNPGPVVNPSGPFSVPSAVAPFAVNEGEKDIANSAPSTLPATGDPAENYRALKAALASLQRISGTR